METLRVQQQIGERLIGRVTHEERRETTALDAQHERGRIDAWIVLRREHRDDRVTDAQPLARAYSVALGVRARDPRGPEIRERAGIQPDRLQRQPHLIAVEHGDETRAVIEMRVRESDDIDAPAPWRQARAELLHEARRIGTAV